MRRYDDDANPKEPSRDRMLRKFRFERAFGRTVANPLVHALAKWGIATSLVTDIETTGRRTALARRVPVSAAFDATGAWLISQHGTRSGWGANIAANPNVALRQRDQWRSATAVLVHDDDVAARARKFSSNALLGWFIAATFRGLQTTPISVRLTFTD